MADPADPGNLVVLQGLAKRFGDAQILRGLDLEVAKGEVVVIIGPSGSGKTTLLRCINFLEDYQGGRILVDGEPVGYREEGGNRARLPDAEAHTSARSERCVAGEGD